MDAQLVVRAQHGDLAAFERLAEPLYAQLQRVAFRILRDQGLAEDAAQQAILGVWQNLPKLRDPARFEAWAYRLLVNACHSETRRRRQWLPNVMTLDDDESVGVDGLGAVVDRDQLERGFRRLSIDHRVVVVLHHYLDLPVDEVATTLGIPTGTVNSRLNRAMHNMRASLLVDDPSRTLETTPSEVTL